MVEKKAGKRSAEVDDWLLYCWREVINSAADVFKTCCNGPARSSDVNLGSWSFTAEIAGPNSKSVLSQPEAWSRST